VTDGKVEFHDIELRRQLSLTTADLRFADHLVRSISDEKGNIFLDSTGINYLAYFHLILHMIVLRLLEHFNTLDYLLV